MEAQVNQTGYTLLLQFAAEASKVEQSVLAAQAKLAGAKEQKAGTYDKAVLAAIACKSAPVFEATMESFMDNIRQNRGGLATKLKAEKREEVGRKGETHKIPSSVSTAKTVLLYALRNGVPLELDGKPRTYGEIREENQATRDLAADKAEAERIEKATGAEKALYEAQSACRDLVAALPTMSEAWLLDVIATVRNAIKGSAEENAKAEAALQAAAKGVAAGKEGSGEQLIEELEKRDARNRGRKAA